MSRFFELTREIEERDEQQRQQKPEVSPTLVETSTVSLAEIATVSLAETTRDLPPLAIPVEKLPLLLEGRVPGELGTRWRSLSTHTLYEARHVRLAALAQHSMTGGQERFYEALWKLKANRNLEVSILGKHRKQIRAGYDVLARATRCAVRSVRTLIAQLIEKQILFSYCDADPTLRRGTLYDVFSYEEILRRQRAAGFCYVVRKGPGVEFAIPEEWTLAISATVPVSATVVRSTRESLADIAVESLADITRPLDRRETFFRQAPPSFSEKLREWVAGIDQEAIDRIWRTGQETSPGISSDQLLDLLRLQLVKIVCHRRLDNPLELLLSSLPQWVKPGVGNCAGTADESREER